MKSDNQTIRKTQLKKYETLTYVFGALISIATLAIGIFSNLLSSLLISSPFGRPLSSMIWVIIVLAIVSTIILGLLLFLANYLGVRVRYLALVGVLLCGGMLSYGLNEFFYSAPSILSTLLFATGSISTVFLLAVYVFVEMRNSERYIKVVLLIVASAIMIGSSYILNNSFYQPVDKILLLVTKFDSAVEEQYKLTNFVVDRLNSSLIKYPDVQVVVIEDSITENQGTEYARSLGKKYNATAVIWGWYSVTQNSAIISLRFDVIESLDNIPYLKVGTFTLSTSAPISDLQNLALQSKISDDVVSNSLFIVGLHEYSNENWEQANNAFSDALNLQSNVQSENTPTLLIYRGNTFAAKREYERAIEDYSSAINMEPNIADAYRARALVYWKIGEINLAQLDNNKALSLEPENFETYLQRGMVYLDSQDYRNAIADFSKAITINPSSDSPYLQRGIAYSNLGEYEKSIADFTQAIQINSNNGLAYYYRGKTYVAIQQNDRAIIDLEKSYDLVDDPQLRSEILALLDKLKQ